MRLTGAVWKFGDGVGATDILPARYDKQGMSRQWAECAKHIFEDAAPLVAGKIQRGDILVAGRGFGVGHAHYYNAAIMGSREAGFGAFLAEGMSGLFLRGAIDFGMPAWVLPGISDFVEMGDLLDVDLALGALHNRTSGASREFKPVSPIILDILEAGGSRDWALRRINASSAGVQG